MNGEPTYEELQLRVRELEHEQSKRKQTEKALATSLRRYDELVARVPVGVYIFWIRADGRMEFEYVNDRYCAIFQLDREAVMANCMLAFDTVHPDELEDHMACNQKAFRDRKPFLWEGRFIIGGEVSWLHVESTPEVFAHGDTRWFGIVQDITERKRAEKALTEERDTLHKLIDGLGRNGIGVDIVGADYKIHYQNKYLRKIFGDVTGKICHKSYIESDIPCDSCPAITAIKSQKASQSVIMAKNDRYFEIMACPLASDSGSIDKAIEVIIDVTEKRQTEKELKRIEWMLSGEPALGINAQTENHGQGYGDLTELNRDGIILKSIGRERLKSFVYDYLELLGTSSAIYEVNGDYAFGIFTSGWCRMMDRASRQLCASPDNGEALKSGRWLCHESCWASASKAAMAKRGPVDIECKGGIRLYAVPIFANEDVIGAINFGYGDPPKEPEKIKMLADLYRLDYDDLVREAAAYDSRPAFIIQVAKKRLHSTAKIIGSMVETNQALEALRESEHWLEESTRIAHVGGWKIDLMGNTLKWTDEIFRILELPTGDPPNVTDTLLFYHEEDRPRVSAMVQRALKNQEGFDFEARIMTAKQNLIWVHAMGHPHFKDGCMDSLWGTIQDITGRKKQEEALEQERNFLKLLLETSPVGITVVNRDGQIAQANTYAEKILGLTRSTLYNRRYDDPAWASTDFAGAPWPVEKQPFQIVKRTGESVFGIEQAIECPNGKRVLLSINAAPFFDNNGNFDGMISVIEDVTERKEVERVIYDSESKFRNLFEMSPLAIALTDIETGKFIDVNDQTCELSQYTKEELIGRTTVELGLYSKEERDIFTSELKSFGKVEGLEMKFKAKDGSLLTTRMHARYVHIVNRDLILTVFNNITTQKQLEEHLRQAQKMEAVGTLSGGIAHEFNNMLGIIIGNTELALDDLPQDNPALDCVQEIRTASLRARDVVRRLLSFARKTPEARIPIQVSKIVEESLSLVRRTLPANIDVRSNLACTDETILADPTEISQVLLNLCTNAAHAMAAEKGVLTVGLETKTLNVESAGSCEDIEPGKYVKLTVSDDGQGIAPDILDRIFEPYFTTKEVDKGLGMGLAVVHGIVKKHGGAIKVHSELGKGTSVEVLFPLLDEQPVSPGEEKETLSTGTERILFVDDEAALVKLTTQMLEDYGYEVVGKTSGAEALEAFKESPEKFDLIITDMSMPDIPGDQLAQKITRMQPNIPVILCTGYSDNMDKDRAMELGIKAFLTKPTEGADLIKTVRKLLDEAKG